MRWGRDLATAPPLIAVDESPDWVFLAGCSPAEPASASPAGAIMPVINLARQCFSTERRNVAYPVVSAQGSTPITSPTPLSPCTTGTSPRLFHDLRNFALQMLGCNLGLKCAHSQSSDARRKPEGRSTQTCLKPPRERLLKAARIDGVIWTCKARRAFPSNCRWP